MIISFGSLLLSYPLSISLQRPTCKEAEAMGVLSLLVALSVIGQTLTSPTIDARQRGKTENQSLTCFAPPKRGPSAGDC